MSTDQVHAVIERLIERAGSGNRSVGVRVVWAYGGGDSVGGGDDDLGLQGRDVVAQAADLGMRRV